MTKEETDWFWFVGIFDGEGGISISMRPMCVGSVNISNNESQIIRDCMGITAAVGIPATHVSLTKRDKGCFVLFWNGYAGVPLLQKLLPFLRNPRQCQRAKLYCKFFDATFKYQSGHRPARAAILSQWEKRWPRRSKKKKLPPEKFI